MLYHIENKTVNAQRIVTDYEDFYFTFAGDNLIVQANRPGAPKNAIRIENNQDYVFCVMKTKIKARGGASELEKFFAENIRPENTFYCRVLAVIKEIANRAA